MKFSEIKNIKLYKSDKLLDGLLTEVTDYLDNRFELVKEPINTKSSELSSLIQDSQNETSNGQKILEQIDVISNEIRSVSPDSYENKSESEIEDLIDKLDRKQEELLRLEEDYDSSVVRLGEIADKIGNRERITKEEISDIFRIKFERYDIKGIKTKVLFLRIAVILIAAVFALLFSEIIEPNLFNYIENTKTTHLLFSIAIFILTDLILENLLNKLYDRFLIKRFNELNDRFQKLKEIFN